MVTNIVIPMLSPTMTMGAITRWLKKEGDRIEKGDVIAEIETDKAIMELESIDAGTLIKIVVSEGSTNIPIGEVIALLEDGEGKDSLKAPTPHDMRIDASASVDHQGAPAKTSGMTTGDRRAPGSEETQSTLASPRAKRLASDAGIALPLTGSGPDGRVVAADVERALQIASQLSGSAESVLVDTPYVAVTHTPRRRSIAQLMSNSKTSIPHFYLSMDCGADELLKMRAAMNAERDPLARLSVTAFAVRASALALRDFPAINASWEKNIIKQYSRVDIAVAIASSEGLVAPVIREADRKSVSGIADALKDYRIRLNSKKLKPEELRGGGLSLSNLGMFGIKQFQAIINPPQAAILAIGAAELRPVVKAGAISIAMVMTFTLSCDHRVVDGATAAEFMQLFRALVETPAQLI
jgi:pyruvate dehydrogenase E2 component (dihydrolipoamide acetyltransferase)